MSQPVFEKHYNAHPSLVPFHESLAQVKALCGPVGSGKSLAACMEFFYLCREATVPIRGIVLRESYRQLHDSTLKTFFEWFSPVAHYVKQHEKIELTIPGVDGVWRTHELHCRHARRVEEASNFLSTEYAFIWLEEVVPAFQTGAGVIGAGIADGIFKVALMRQRQAEAHRLHVILTFNPPNKYHWTYEQFFRPSSAELERQGFQLFRQPARENAAHLPPKYYERLEEQLPPDMVSRFVLGEPVTMYPGVRVYPECREAKHTAEEVLPIPGLPLICMYDYGLTPVVLFSQLTERGQFRILREIQLWNASVEKLAEEMKRQMHDFLRGLDYGRGWGDPAGGARSQTDEKTCFEILGKHGFNVLPGAIDLRTRLESVKQRLRRTDDDGEPAIIMDRQRCPVLTEGMLGGYRYPQSSDGQLGSAPLKNEFSHSCNALEYGCSGEFSVMDGSRRQQPKKKPKQWNPLERGRGGLGGSWMVN